MSTLTPHTAKALALALLAAALPAQASVEAGRDGLTDAELELTHEITGIEELGSAKRRSALVALLRRVLPVIPVVPA